MNTHRYSSADSNPGRGIALTVIGSGCIVLNDAAMKWVVTDHPIGEAIFVRGIFAVLPIALLVRRGGGWSALRWHSARAQLWCALMLAVPIFVFVYSLSQMALALATLIYFTNPLFVTLLAPLVNQEAVGWRRRIAVLVGFIGAVLVIRPTTASFQWVLLGPVLCAFMSAWRDLYLRRILHRESSVAILCYSTLLVTLASLATAPLGWDPLSGLDIALLAVSGLGFGFGIFFMTDALRYAGASLVALYKYSSIVWALLMGYLAWGDVPRYRGLGRRLAGYRKRLVHSLS